ncbi:MAG: YtxH protein [Clostridiales bacterium]|jgi:gas vesicle protein|nr:YtxH protein [Clostridiales bacterium]
MGKKIVFDFNGKRKAKKNLQKGIVTGAAIGTFLGAVGGILFAPKSGKETREDIKKGVDTAVEKTTYTIKTTSKKAAQEVKEMGSKIGQEAKKLFKKKQVTENIEGQVEELDLTENKDENIKCDTCSKTSACDEEQEVK